MSILCRILGHNFNFIEADVTPTWSRLHAPHRPISDWYRTIHVAKDCARCGYRHGNTFKVPNDWPAQPDPTP
ncbi:hypothetical protein GCM10027191_15430 [Novilysobacter erysipheiresistens]